MNKTSKGKVVKKSSKSLTMEKYSKLCTHCGEDKRIRNKSGYCDHLYYPDNCEVCKGEEKGLYTISSKKFKTLNKAREQMAKWEANNLLDKKAHIYRVVEVIR